MFGKPEWFTYRSTGWGIAPKTWQGWAYVGVAIALFAALIGSPIPEGMKRILVGFLGGLLVVDAIAIWAQLGKHHDERQRLHQLIIERNGSVVAVIAVFAVIVFRAYQNRNMIGAGTLPFDPLLLAVLGAMVLTKLISTIYLRFKM